MDAYDTIIEKIKKAVRLANRTTEEGERNTAMRLARQLADKNNICLDDIDVGDGSADRAVMEEDDRYRTMTGSELGFIYYILDRHFGVIVMERRLKANHSKRAFTWFGPKVNIEIGKYVFKILLRESQRAYNQMRTDTFQKVYDAYTDVYGSMPLATVKKEVALMKLRPVKRQDFMRGFFTAIDEKLKANPIRNDIDASRQQAEKKLDEYRQINKTIKDKKMKKSNGNIDMNAVAMGFGAGKDINLSRPCESNGLSPMALCA